MFTRHALDLDAAKDAATPFGRAHAAISAVLNPVARYSAQASLNPNETCEFPADMRRGGGRCLIFDGYPSYPADEPEEFGLMAVIEVFRSEMGYARRNGVPGCSRGSRRRGITRIPTWSASRSRSDGTPSDGPCLGEAVGSAQAPNGVPVRDGISFRRPGVGRRGPGGRPSSGRFRPAGRGGRLRDFGCSRVAPLGLPSGRVSVTRTGAHRRPLLHFSLKGAIHVSPRQEAHVHRQRRQRRPPVRQHAPGAVRRGQRRVGGGDAVFDPGAQLRGPGAQGPADGHRHRGAEPPGGHRHPGPDAPQAHEDEPRGGRGRPADRHLRRRRRLALQLRRQPVDGRLPEDHRRARTWTCAATSPPRRGPRSSTSG